MAQLKKRYEFVACLFSKVRRSKFPLQKQTSQKQNKTKQARVINILIDTHQFWLFSCRESRDCHSPVPSLWWQSKEELSPRSVVSPTPPSPLAARCCAVWYGGATVEGYGPRLRPRRGGGATDSASCCPDIVGLDWITGPPAALQSIFDSIFRLQGCMFQWWLICDRWTMHERRSISKANPSIDCTVTFMGKPIFRSDRAFERYLPRRQSEELIHDWLVITGLAVADGPSRKWDMALLRLGAELPLNPLKMPLCEWHTHVNLVKIAGNYKEFRLEVYAI